MIRLVAVDMDGTLLGPDGRISPGNARAVERLQNSKRELLICTGRGYRDAMLPLKERGIECGAVCMNGAAVYDRRGKLLDKKELPGERVEEIIRCCEGERVIFDFMTDRGSYSTSTEEEFKDYFDRRVLLPMAEYTYQGIREQFNLVEPEKLFSLGLEFYKISVIHESPQVLGRIKARLGRLRQLAVASSFATNLEITHEDAQKGKALAAYASMRGVRLDEIMAIGDSENDLSMLSMDLKYTVAMENAVESIKKTAKFQTRSNHRDGVAYAIETLALAGEARAAFV